MLDRKIIIKDLRTYYSDDVFQAMTSYTYDNIPENELRKFFNLHCDKHKTVVTSQELYNNYGDACMLINSPDGFVEVGALVQKAPKVIYTVKTAGHKIRCSNDHMIETPSGWQRSEQLSVGDFVLTKDGYQEIKYIRKGKTDVVYDLEVLTDQHRYWGGSGISSHNTGKSYLALSICRNAQKKGYTPIYLDSEAAMDIDFVKRLGCDPDNFIIKTVTTVTEVSTFIARTCKEMLDIPEEERPKIVFVLDSLGNLTSEKELNDTIEGNDKRDMTRAQNIKALFRTNATALGRLGYAFIVVAHIYQTQEMFSKTVVSGGCLAPDSLVITESGPKKISQIEVGEKVLDEYGFFSKVVETFKFKKPTYTISFSLPVEGETEDHPVIKMECSKDHRFLVKVTEGDYKWKKAEDIEENNEVLRITEYTSPVSDTKIRPHYETCFVVDKHENPETDVCDLCVDYSHTYVTENGIINHNSGINFNASLTMLLSTAKLDDKESDKIAESKTGEYVKTGVLVTAKPHKSRFTIPQKVKFQIPFFKAPNPYVGLEAYINWDNAGIMRGEILTEKEYEKLTPDAKAVCKEMVDSSGKKCYARQKDTSKKIVVKHLGCEVPLAELYSSKVLTEDILRHLDETVIRPNFELPSNESNDDIDDLVNDNDE